MLKYSKNAKIQTSPENMIVTIISHVLCYDPCEKRLFSVDSITYTAYLDDEQLMELQLLLWKLWYDARLLLEIAKAHVGRHPEIDKMVSARERIFLVQKSSTNLFTFAD